MKLNFDKMSFHYRFTQDCLGWNYLSGKCHSYIEGKADFKFLKPLSNGFITSLSIFKIEPLTTCSSHSNLINFSFLMIICYECD